MSLTYRAEKGAPLTIEEMDSNFRELETRLKTLEDFPEHPEGLSKIQLDGDQMTFLGSFGTNFGTFSLPQALFNPCGEWTAQTDYQKGDIVFCKDTLYICNSPHKSLALENQLEHWTLLFSLSSSAYSSPIYEKATLPMEERIGKLEVFAEDGGLNIIFFNGTAWQRLKKGEEI